MDTTEYKPRDKRKAKKCIYLLIGGFSLGEAGHVAPTITINEGNAYGERITKTVKTFPDRPGSQLYPR